MVTKPFEDTSDATRRIMRANVNRDTKPEMVVRRLLHSLGYRYRLHRNDLPGRPDIVFPVRRKVVEVHGCFWHHHECQGGRLPKTRQAFWREKLERNRARDKRNVEALNDLGWRVLTVWECELRYHQVLRVRLECFLNDPGGQEA